MRSIANRVFTIDRQMGVQRRGRLDGYLAPPLAEESRYQIDQFVQEFAFKCRGFSAQQEYHWKTIKDQSTNTGVS